MSVMGYTGFIRKEKPPPGNMCDKPWDLQVSHREAERIWLIGSPPAGDWEGATITMARAARATAGWVLGPLGRYGERWYLTPPVIRNAPWFVYREDE